MHDSQIQADSDSTVESPIENFFLEHNYNDLVIEPYEDEINIDQLIKIVKIQKSLRIFLKKKNKPNNLGNRVKFE